MLLGYSLVWAVVGGGRRRGKGKGRSCIFCGHSYFRAVLCFGTSKFTSMRYQLLQKIVTDNYIADESKLFRENWGVGLDGNHLYGLLLMVRNLRNIHAVSVLPHNQAEYHSPVRLHLLSFPSLQAL